MLRSETSRAWAHLYGPVPTWCGGATAVRRAGGVSCGVVRFSRLGARGTADCVRKRPGRGRGSTGEGPGTGGQQFAWPAPPAPRRGALLFLEQVAARVVEASRVMRSAEFGRHRKMQSARC